MNVIDDGRLLRIFICESDEFDGHPLDEVVLDRHLRGRRAGHLEPEALGGPLELEFVMECEAHELGVELMEAIRPLLPLWLV